jgi:RimJ/RimL family protein N-acetyltransferase
MKKSAKAKKPAKSKKKSSPAKKRVKPRGKPRIRAFGAAYYAQSERLGFRLIEAGDEAFYCGLYTDADTMEHVCAPLTDERAKQSFAKALASSQQKPWTQRISAIVERETMKPLGIASIKWVDLEKRIAEVGILLQPDAHSQRYATEASQALLNSAFRRYTIDGITARVTTGHKAVERLVVALGYDKGRDLEATPDCHPRTLWSMNREKWAGFFK